MSSEAKQPRQKELSWANSCRLLLYHQPSEISRKVKKKKKGGGQKKTSSAVLRRCRRATALPAPQERCFLFPRP